jgi:hypothetical protein
MSQVSAYPVAAHGRSTWRALRPLLLLGGFALLWWALMTGVAHADGSDKPRPSVLDQVRSAAKAHATPDKKPTAKPARDLVGKTRETVKATTTQVTHRVTTDVRKTVEPVTRSVTATVESTPVVGKVTKAATQTLGTTVTKTRALLNETAVGPVVDPVLKPVDEVVTTNLSKPESSTGQGNSPSTGPSGQSAATSFAEQLPTAFEAGGQSSASTAGDHRVTSSNEGGSPLDGPRGTPLSPDPCASPSGSGSTSFTPVGSTESSLLTLPSVLRDQHTWRLARLSGGPAYEPGSSPD